VVLVRRYLRYLPLALMLALAYCHWVRLSFALVDRWMGRR
jgi:hypothetical protein